MLIGFVRCFLSEPSTDCELIVHTEMWHTKCKAANYVKILETGQSYGLG